MKSKSLFKFFYEEIILNILIILLFLFFFPLSILLKIFKVNLLGLNNKDKSYWILRKKKTNLTHQY